MVLLIPPTTRELEAVATATGFAPVEVEKAVRLLALLDDLADHPYLGERIALFGGTAINMFLLDIPRLSFDLDLNYIGSADPNVMRAEKPRFDAELASLIGAHGLEVRRRPLRKSHAGGKWVLPYQTAWGTRTTLSVDVNFVRRVPLWAPTRRDSHRLGRWQATGVPVVDVHELAAGKLSAYYERGYPRDLYDAGLIPHLPGLDPDRLRTAFVVYTAGSRKDWRTAGQNPPPRVSLTDLAKELRSALPETEANRLRHADADQYRAELEQEAAAALRLVLPFRPAEQAFVDQVRSHAEVVPELLTDDPLLQQRIAAEPWLKWRTQKIRERLDASAQPAAPRRKLSGSVPLRARPYILDNHGWEVTTTAPDGTPRQLSGRHPTVEEAEQTRDFMVRVLNTHPQLHILGSSVPPARSGAPTASVYADGRHGPWYVQCQNPDGTEDTKSPPYPTYQTASNILDQLELLHTATADHALGQRAVAEPTSTSCRCSLKGWRCEHIEVEGPEADPPNLGYGLSL